jgi:hypothetical protein
MDIRSFGAPTRMRKRLPRLVLAAAVLASSVAAAVTTAQPASANIEDFLIGSYNMQGGNNGARWTTDVARMLRGINTPEEQRAGRTLVALQEAGARPPGSAVWEVNYSRIRNQHISLAAPARDQVYWQPQRWVWRPFGANRGTYYIYFLRTDLGGNGGGRVNLAIVTNRPADGVRVAQPAFRTSRPALGVRFGDTTYWTVHALASGGNDQRGLINNIARASTVGTARLWAAIGDWNRPPENSQRDTGFIYRTGRATHQGGRELDYMVANSLMVGLGATARGFGSDHFSLWFDLMRAGAGVSLFIARDGNRSVTGATTNTYLGRTFNDSKGIYSGGEWRFIAKANGRYSIKNARSGGCLDATFTQLQEAICDNTEDQLFNVRPWRDAVQFALQSVRWGTCIGDGPYWGEGTKLSTEMECNKGEARFNWRFEHEPPPGAAPVLIR